MTQQESKAINIARFIFVVGVLFIHFPISYISADDISLVASDTPYYNQISSRFFLTDTCLSGLFLLSGYLFFKNIRGGDCLKTQYHMSEILQSVSLSDDSDLPNGCKNRLSGRNISKSSRDAFNLKVESSQNGVFRRSGGVF